MTAQQNITQQLLAALKIADRFLVGFEDTGESEIDDTIRTVREAIAAGESAEKPKLRILVETSGGVVTDVHCSGIDCEAETVLVDYDEAQNGGDESPTEEQLDAICSAFYQEPHSQWVPFCD